MQGVTTRPMTGPIKIRPLGDIQWDGDTAHVAYNHLKTYIEEGVADHSYFLGTGDYIDFASPSNRAALQRAGLYDTAIEVIEGAALRCQTQLAMILNATRNQWLGLLSGHHLFQFRDGTTTDTRLAGFLGAPHLGDCAYIRIPFLQGDKVGYVRVWCHHGTGGSTIQGVFRKLESAAAVFEAHVYVVGHATKRGAVPKARLVDCWHGDSFRLRHDEYWLVAAGGWLKGYREGNKHGEVAAGDYVEKNMMTPVALGSAVIHVTPRWTDRGFEPTINVQP
jgi:hypothetical protein